MYKRLCSYKDICDAFEKSISYLENNKSITLNLGSAKGFSVKRY